MENEWWKHQRRWWCLYLTGEGITRNCGNSECLTKICLSNAYFKQPRFLQQFGSVDQAMCGGTCLLLSGARKWDRRLIREEFPHVTKIQTIHGAGAGPKQKTLAVDMRHVLDLPLIFLVTYMEVTFSAISAYKLRHSSKSQIKARKMPILRSCSLRNSNPHKFMQLNLQAYRRFVVFDHFKVGCSCQKPESHSRHG